MKKNILLLKGGGASEHAISLISSDYIESKINKSMFEVFTVELDKDSNWFMNGKPCSFDLNKTLKIDEDEHSIDAAIPCFHGYPGETGTIQSLFEFIGLPYLGCNSETSIICFNKLLTKLFLENAGVKTTPFLKINDALDLKEANNFFDNHGECYLKATNQGSSVGCYRIKNKNDIEENINEAFKFSPHVILEKAIIGRELEVSVFEFDGVMNISEPGEIICETDFYDYNEKYSSNSSTKTIPIAENLSSQIKLEIKRQAELATSALKIRHLSRIDFFLSEDGEVFINEINTFPGHTKISMFPMMMEQSGVSYSNFLNQNLQNITQ